MVSLPEWNLNQVIIYQLEVHKYIGFKTLTMNCGQATFKNARTIFFSKLGGTGSSFRSGSKKNSKTILGAARICLPLQVRRGTLMSAERERTWWNSRGCRWRPLSLHPIAFIYACRPDSTRIVRMKTKERGDVILDASSTGPPHPSRHSRRGDKRAVSRVDEQWMNVGREIWMSNLGGMIWWA